MPKFSIIVPIYNSEKYLKNCIDSILNQTYGDFELLMIDDGSTDMSSKICDEYEKKDDRIRVVHKKNGGVSTARNNGLNVAEGEYLIFVDSDDSIEKYMLERINEKIIENDADFIICGKFKEEQEINLEKIINNTDIENLKDMIINEKINSTWGKAYKRKIMQMIRFDTSITIGEDLLFNIEYMKKTKRIYMLNKKLYNYNTENENSLTKKYIKNKYEQLTKVNIQLENYLKQYKNKKLDSVSAYIKLKNKISCIIDLNNKECNLTIKEKQNYIKCLKKDNKRIIKYLGIEKYIISILFILLPNWGILEISKILFRKKEKRTNSGK